MRLPRRLRRLLVSDVLGAAGRDLRGYPYPGATGCAAALLDGTVPPLALVPMTTDAARARLTGHLDAGIEGVVAKRLDQPYRVRSSWRKV